MVLLLLIPLKREAASKVVWFESRGIPLPFLALSVYRGPCWPERDFCTRLGLESLDLLPLFADLLFIYLLSCAVSLAHPLRPQTRDQ